MPINTKQRLVDAALALFAEKGYRATTIQEIAGKACTNVAAINYHFQSKANFYAEVVISAMEVEKIELLQVDATPENAERLVRDFIDYQIRDRNQEDAGACMARIRAQEMADPGPVLDTVLEKLIKPLLNQLDTVMRLLLPADADNGVIRRHTLSLVSQIQFYNLEKNFLVRAYPEVDLDEAELERISQHLFNGVMASIGAEHMRSNRARSA